MPFGRYVSCAQFVRVLEMGTLGRDAVKYSLRQHAVECDCDCDVCVGLRDLLVRLTSEDAADPP